MITAAAAAAAVVGVVWWWRRREARASALFETPTMNSSFAAGDETSRPITVVRSTQSGEPMRAAGHHATADGNDAESDEPASISTAAAIVTGAVPGCLTYSVAQPTAEQPAYLVPKPAYLVPFAVALQPEYASIPPQCATPGRSASLTAQSESSSLQPTPAPGAADYAVFRDGSALCIQLEDPRRATDENGYVLPPKKASLADDARHASTDQSSTKSEAMHSPPAGYAMGGGAGGAGDTSPTYQIPMEHGGPNTEDYATFDASSTYATVPAPQGLVAGGGDASYAVLNRPEGQWVGIGL